ncbi:MAG: hypothetical protein N2169_07655 [bacterium]|nr:hypothetical protein [bacterium]
MIIFLQSVRDFIIEQDLVKIIDLIKTRLQIVSIECNYKSTLFINPELCGGESIPIENQFKFKYQDGNFLLSKTNVKKKTRIIENSPRNLLEILSIKFNNPQKISQSISKGTEEIIGYTNLYFYKGKSAFRRFFFEESGTPITYLTINDKETQNEYGKSGDPRWIIGFIGFNLDSQDAEHYSFTSCPPRRITELLDIPGKTHIRKEGNYRILFHCIESSCNVSNCIYDNESTCRLMEEYEKWFSFEIWIDDKDNIVKIVEIDYLPIIYGENFVNKICKFSNDSFFPFEKRREFIFDDFFESSSGVRVPLKSSILTFRNESIIAQFMHNFIIGNTNIIEDYKEKKISAEELRVSLNCYGPDESLYFSTVLLEIDPDTLKINEPISEETFIAPSVQIDHRKELNEDKKIKEQKEANYTMPLFFIIVFIILTFLSIFITRRYFNRGV